LLLLFCRFLGGEPRLLCGGSLLLLGLPGRLGDDARMLGRLGRCGGLGLLGLLRTLRRKARLLLLRQTRLSTAVKRASSAAIFFNCPFARFAWKPSEYCERNASQPSRVPSCNANS